MISGGELYTVISAVVPLYVAMFLAYGSVKWWKIFTPEQCAGINKFVAIFAIPLLSFEFISRINPYKMNFVFMAADIASKLIVLLLLTLWSKLSERGSLDWVITLFSLSTLPNTLVMGIPLLNAMYGYSTQSLMVQVVVMQCILWYTLLLILYEYRSANMMLIEQFHGGTVIQASNIDEKDPNLQTDSIVNIDSEDLHGLVRKPTSTSISQGQKPTQLSQRMPQPENSNSQTDCFDIMYNCNQSKRYLQSIDSTSPTDEIVSIMSSGRVVSPRDQHNGKHGNSGRVESPREQYNGKNGKSKSVISLGSGRIYSNRHLGSGRIYSNRYLGSFSQNALSLAKMASRATNYSPKLEDEANELHMFIWSSESSFSEADKHWDQHELHGDNFRPGKKLSGLEGELASHVKKDHRLPDLIPTSMPTPKTPQLLQQDENGRNVMHSKSPSTAIVMKLILTMVCSKLVYNPNFYASLLGILWALISARWDLEMPQIIKGSITILSNAGLGIAMFSLGLFMALQPRIIACGTYLAIIGMVLRFLAGPAAMAVASVAVGLRGGTLHVSIIQAALPQGIVPFVFAMEYNLHPDILSTAVIFGMLVSLPVTLVYYVLLEL